MAKKKSMGRDLSALLGGASRKRQPKSETESSDVAAKPDAPKADASAASEDQNVSAESSAGSSSQATTNKAAPSADINIPNNVNLTADQSVAVESAKQSDTSGDRAPGDRVRKLGVDQIKRGLFQPRRHFDEEKLQELAESIRQQGVIQPVLVRPYAGSFELIAGERRWRAAQLAGIDSIPAIVREMDDQKVAAVALIENIQRADLNPLEEAEALQRLCEEFSMTHQAVAESVGRSRAAVSNLLRLLELHDDVKPLVDTGALEMGHARALLGAPKDEQPALARRIAKENLTVRAVEGMIRALREGKSSKKKSNTVNDPNIDALGKKLGEILGAPVQIHHQKGGSGKLEIRYTSVSELEGILSHIK